MHVTRTPGLPALAIVMPHPQLPQSSRSSLSSSLCSPRTPRTPSCSSNTLFTETTNRNSTDSWNSSNAADDLEWEWKPEQIRLLSRTLDALPAHLVTPFNGPIPPSNLLDKIARGISQAKGPIDWPHSLRATRVKLIEISRAHAKEDKQSIAEVPSGMEMDEKNDRPGYKHHSESSGIKRPLYRQSSMDFMNAADLRDDKNIPCLSDRLQRADRLTSKTTYHPYTRNATRLSSPNSLVNVPSLLSPSTPSSSTLNTLSSFSSMNRALRRTSSNLSSTSASSMSVRSGNAGATLQDPRVQRVRRSESFYGPITPPKDIKLVPSTHKENRHDSPSTVGLKRAPSFGTLAQEARRDRQVLGDGLHFNVEEMQDSSACPSSDEEEKVRTKGAKKMRVKDAGGLILAASVGTPPNSPPSAAPCSPKKTRNKVSGPVPILPGCKSLTSPNSPHTKPKKRGSLPVKDMPTDAGTDKLGNLPTAAATKERRKPSAPMNLQRNPSILGAELPHVRNTSSQGQTTDIPYSYNHASPRGRRIRLAEQDPIRVVSPDDVLPIKALDSPPKVKTLRRVQRLAIGRRISFGSLIPPGEDADAEEDGEEHTRDRRRQRELGQLGSAFQLA